MWLLGMLLGATPDQIIGEYAWEHDIGLMYAADRKTCRAEGARWRRGLCTTTGADTVTINRAADALSVHITTLSTNFHICELEAPATLDGDVLRIQGDDGCEVAVTWSMAGVKVDTLHPSCQMYCGANATMDIPLAARVKP